jgi:hypothetical protein
MQFAAIFHTLLLAVAVASLLLIALTWAEGAIAIWLPRSADSRFWKTYDKLLSTLRYISASEDKLARARFILPSERASDEK